VHRLDVGKRPELMMFAPGEESADGMEVSRPRVPVADGPGKEFQEASAAWSPAPAITCGTTMPSRAATVRVRDDGMATCWLMPLA
jgi:hypothetical protein